MRCLAVASLVVLSLVSPVAQTLPAGERVLTHREQAPLIKGWIAKRFDTVLPELMRREGIDLWIIVSREYNDDPVFRSMAPLTTYSSRRRTILAFFRTPQNTVERVSIGRFDYDGLFTVVKTGNDEQWDGLRRFVEARDPKEPRRRSHRDRARQPDEGARSEVLAAGEVRRDARRRLARGEASRRDRRIPTRHAHRPSGHSRGVLQSADRARRDHL
jgi:hypothetical protein